MTDADRRRFLQAAVSCDRRPAWTDARRSARVDAPSLDASARAAAAALIESVPPSLQPQLLFDLHDPNRTDWHYLPTLVEGVPDALRGGFHARRGVSLAEMDGLQRGLALELLRTLLDSRGWETISAIMAREAVVREHERDPATASGFRARLGDELHARVRDPALYFLAVFGRPTDAAPWSLRFEGHHLSLHATFVPGMQPAITPLFFGAFPAVLGSIGSARCEPPLRRCWPSIPNTRESSWCAAKRGDRELPTRRNVLLRFPSERARRVRTTLG